MPLFNNLERKLQDQEVTRQSPLAEEPAENEFLEQMSRHYKERLLREADVQAITKLSSREMRRVVERLLAQFMSEERLVLPRRDRDYLISRILDESVGLGPWKLC